MVSGEFTSDQVHPGRAGKMRTVKKLQLVSEVGSLGKVV